MVKILSLFLFSERIMNIRSSEIRSNINSLEHHLQITLFAEFKITFSRSLSSRFKKKKKCVFGLTKNL